MNSFNNWMASVKQEDFTSDLLKACKNFKLQPATYSPNIPYGASFSFTLSLESANNFDIHEIVILGNEVVTEISQLVVIQATELGKKDGMKVLTLNDNNISSYKDTITEYLMDIRKNVLYKTLLNDLTKYPENSTRCIIVSLEASVLIYQTDTYLASILLGTCVAVMDENKNILEREEVRNSISEVIRRDNNQE